MRGTVSRTARAWPRPEYPQSSCWTLAHDRLRLVREERCVDSRQSRPVNGETSVSELANSETLVLPPDHFSRRSRLSSNCQ